MKKISNKHNKVVVIVKKDLTKKEGEDKAIKKALRETNGDFRSCIYDPKTGKAILK